MQKSKLMKGLVLGIIVLFIGASVVPSISGIINEKGEISSTLNDGLVGYWKFDEGSGDIAHDSSGHNNNGTIYGASWVILLCLHIYSNSCIICLICLHLCPVA